MGYPTTAELVAASSVAELTDLDAAQQDGLREAAIDAVEAHCKQAFTVEGTVGAPVTRRVSGANSDRLDLPRRLAVLSALSIDGQVWQLGDVSLDDQDGAFIEMVSPLDGGSWVTRARRSPGDPGPVFALGRGNVAVSGVWGWTDAEWDAGLLSNIETAIRLDMEDAALADVHKLSSTVRSARALGVDSVSQGALSLTLRGSEPGLSARVKRQLKGFVWTGRIGAVV